MPGPKPTPTALRKLAGNPGKRALPKNEPEPSRGRLSCPPHLDATAKTEWRRLLPILQGMRVMTDADYGVLEMCCRQTSVSRQAWKQLQADGPIVDSMKGAKRITAKTETGETVVLNLIERQRHPAVKLMNDADAIVKQCYGELGLTPAARTKVKTIDAFKGDENPWTQIGQNYQDDQSPIQ